MFNTPNNVLSQTQMFINRLKIKPQNDEDFLSEAFNSVIENTYVKQLKLIEDWLSWHNEEYPDFDINKIQLTDHFKEMKHYLIAEYYPTENSTLPLFSYAVILTIPDGGSTHVASITCISNPNTGGLTV